MLTDHPALGTFSASVTDRLAYDYSMTVKTAMDLRMGETKDVNLFSYLLAKSEGGAASQLLDLNRLAEQHILQAGMMDPKTDVAGTPAADKLASIGRAISALSSPMASLAYLSEWKTANGDAKNSPLMRLASDIIAASAVVGADGQPDLDSRRTPAALLTGDVQAQEAASWNPNLTLTADQLGLERYLLLSSVGRLTTSIVNDTVRGFAQTLSGHFTAGQYGAAWAAWTGNPLAQSRPEQMALLAGSADRGAFLQAAGLQNLLYMDGAQKLYQPQSAIAAGMTASIAELAPFLRQAEGTMAAGFQSGDWAGAWSILDGKAGASFDMAMHHGNHFVESLGLRTAAEYADYLRAPAASGYSDYPELKSNLILAKQSGVRTGVFELADTLSRLSSTDRAKLPDLFALSAQTPVEDGKVRTLQAMAQPGLTDLASTAKGSFAVALISDRSPNDMTPIAASVQGQLRTFLLDTSASAASQPGLRIWMFAGDGKALPVTAQSGFQRTNPDGSTARISEVELKGLTVSTGGASQFFGHYRTDAAQNSPLLIKQDAGQSKDGSDPTAAGGPAGPAHHLQSEATAALVSGADGQAYMSLSGRVGFWGEQLVFKTVGSRITIASDKNTFVSGLSGLRQDPGLKVYSGAVEYTLSGPVLATGSQTDIVKGVRGTVERTAGDQNRFFLGYTAPAGHMGGEKGAFYSESQAFADFITGSLGSSRFDAAKLRAAVDQALSPDDKGFISMENRGLFAQMAINREMLGGISDLFAKTDKLTLSENDRAVLAFLQSAVQTHENKVFDALQAPNGLKVSKGLFHGEENLENNTNFLLKDSVGMTDLVSRGGLQRASQLLSGLVQASSASPSGQILRTPEALRSWRTSETLRLLGAQGSAAQGWALFNGYDAVAEIPTASGQMLIRFLKTADAGGKGPIVLQTSTGSKVVNTGTYDNQNLDIQIKDSVLTVRGAVVTMGSETLTLGSEVLTESGFDGTDFKPADIRIVLGNNQLVPENPGTVYDLSNGDQVRPMQFALTVGEDGALRVSVDQGVYRSMSAPMDFTQALTQGTREHTNTGLLKPVDIQGGLGLNHTLIFSGQVMTPELAQKIGPQMLSNIVSLNQLAGIDPNIISNLKSVEWRPGLVANFVYDAKTWTSVLSEAAKTPAGRQTLADYHLDRDVVTLPAWVGSRMVDGGWLNSAEVIFSGSQKPVAQGQTHIFNELTDQALGIDFRVSGRVESLDFFHKAVHALAKEQSSFEQADAAALETRINEIKKKVGAFEIVSKVSPSFGSSSMPAYNSMTTTTYETVYFADDKVTDPKALSDIAALRNSYASFLSDGKSEALNQMFTRFVDNLVETQVNKIKESLGEGKGFRVETFDAGSFSPSDMGGAINIESYNVHFADNKITDPAASQQIDALRDLQKQGKEGLTTSVNLNPVSSLMFNSGSQDVHTVTIGMSLAVPDGKSQVTAENQLVWSYGMRFEASEFRDSASMRDLISRIGTNMDRPISYTVWSDENKNALTAINLSFADKASNLNLEAQYSLGQLSDGLFGKTGLLSGGQGTIREAVIDAYATIANRDLTDVEVDLLLQNVTIRGNLTDGAKATGASFIVTADRLGQMAITIGASDGVFSGKDNIGSAMYVNADGVVNGFAVSLNTGNLISGMQPDDQVRYNFRRDASGLLGYQGQLGASTSRVDLVEDSLGRFWLASNLGFNVRNDFQTAGFRLDTNQMRLDLFAQSSELVQKNYAASINWSLGYQIASLQAGRDQNGGWAINVDTYHLAEKDRTYGAIMDAGDLVQGVGQLAVSGFAAGLLTRGVVALGGALYTELTGITVQAARATSLARIEGALESGSFWARGMARGRILGQSAAEKIAQSGALSDDAARLVEAASTAETLGQKSLQAAGYIWGRATAGGWSGFAGRYINMSLVVPASLNIAGQAFSLVAVRGLGLDENQVMGMENGLLKSMGLMAIQIGKASSFDAFVQHNFSAHGQFFNLTFAAAGGLMDLAAESVGKGWSAIARKTGLSTTSARLVLGAGHSGAAGVVGGATSGTMEAGATLTGFGAFSQAVRSAAGRALDLGSRTWNGVFKSSAAESFKEEVVFENIFEAIVLSHFKNLDPNAGEFLQELTDVVLGKRSNVSVRTADNNMSQMHRAWNSLRAEAGAGLIVNDPAEQAFVSAMDTFAQQQDAGNTAQAQVALGQAFDLWNAAGGPASGWSAMDYQGGTTERPGVSTIMGALWHASETNRGTAAWLTTLASAVDRLVWTGTSNSADQVRTAASAVTESPAAQSLANRVITALSGGSSSEAVGRAAGQLVAEVLRSAATMTRNNLFNAISADAALELAILQIALNPAAVIGANGMSAGQVRAAFQILVGAFASEGRVGTLMGQVDLLLSQGAQASPAALAKAQALLAVSVADALSMDPGTQGAKFERHQWMAGVIMPAAVALFAGEAAAISMTQEFVENFSGIPVVGKGAVKALRAAMQMSAGQLSAFGRFLTRSAATPLLFSHHMPFVAWAAAESQPGAPGLDKVREALGLDQDTRDGLDKVTDAGERAALVRMILVAPSFMNGVQLSERAGSVLLSARLYAGNFESVLASASDQVKTELASLLESSPDRSNLGRILAVLVIANARKNSSADSLLYTSMAELKSLPGFENFNTARITTDAVRVAAAPSIESVMAAMADAARSGAQLPDSAQVPMQALLTRIVPWLNTTLNRLTDPKLASSWTAAALADVARDLNNAVSMVLFLATTNPDLAQQAASGIAAVTQAAALRLGDLLRAPDAVKNADLGRISASLMTLADGLIALSSGLTSLGLMTPQLSRELGAAAQTVADFAVETSLVAGARVKLLTEQFEKNGGSALSLGEAAQLTEAAAVMDRAAPPVTRRRGAGLLPATAPATAAHAVRSEFSKVLVLLAGGQAGLRSFLTQNSGLDLTEAQLADLSTAGEHLITAALNGNVFLSLSAEQKAVILVTLLSVTASDPALRQAAVAASEAARGTVQEALKDAYTEEAQKGQTASGARIAQLLVLQLRLASADGRQDVPALAEGLLGLAGTARSAVILSIENDPAQEASVKDLMRQIRESDLTRRTEQTRDELVGALQSLASDANTTDTALAQVVLTLAGQQDGAQAQADAVLDLLVRHVPADRQTAVLAASRTASTSGALRSLVSAPDFADRLTAALALQAPSAAARQPGQAPVQTAVLSVTVLAAAKEALRQLVFRAAVEGRTGVRSSDPTRAYLVHAETLAEPSNRASFERLRNLADQLNRTAGRDILIVAEFGASAQSTPQAILAEAGITDRRNATLVMSQATYEQQYQEWSNVVVAKDHLSFLEVMALALTYKPGFLASNDVDYLQTAQAADSGSTGGTSGRSFVRISSGTDQSSAEAADKDIEQMLQAEVQY